MIPFYKFHGTGNDFIMIDGFTVNPLLTATRIREACNRHTGIGSDGIIIVVPSEMYDFEMIYYNSDGSKASMCGNGARCAVAFCHMLGIIPATVKFLAGDGVHEADVAKSYESEWEVQVTMTDTDYPVKHEDGYYINTGTHHFVKLVDNLKDIEIQEEGSQIRHDPRFSPHGVNVNWVSLSPGMLNVRTFEKGVESETLSCGTGVTAAALVASLLTYDCIWKVETKGGSLEVTLKINDDYFSDVKLKGPARLVFTGETNLF